MKGYKTFFILIFGNHHHLRCQHLLHHVSNVFILFLQCAWECLNWIQEWVMYIFITSQGLCKIFELEKSKPFSLQVQDFPYCPFVPVGLQGGCLHVHIIKCSLIVLVYMFSIPAIYYTINAWCFSFHVVNVLCRRHVRLILF